MKDIFIGVDFGGTRIKLGIVFQGQIIADANIEAASELSFEQRLADIALEMKHLLSQGAYRLIGIGFAFPGIVNFYTGRILSKYVKYPGAENVDLQAWAKVNFGVPIAVENDARAALIGEWKHGAGMMSTDLVLVTLGTGVGTGALVNGAPLRGKNFIGGNLGGHSTINFEGSICNCGNVGCVESESSTWALTQIAKASAEFASSKLAELQIIDFKNLFELAAQGDALAITLQERCLKVWSLCVINLIHAYDPQKVIFGGGIIKSSHIILPYIKEMLDKHSWIGSGDVDLVVAARPEHAGILGVYELLKQKITDNAIELR
ncbi:ROK family protein [Dyadobacter chenhuakuii]|uniref:ROK family protein n=1 Tax=Dyadobacter chenhuakuii TaxID=2909339 RepID=A0ABY4XM75_9BACT|nr:ROK family protein [Dyadobacter chenhuakuii]MCF2494219.1 ROK family protein [Dyadobacter chenhuakuii]USJ31346.1 ROK family protein [Dyadobacter chenhuakuii]